MNRRSFWKSVAAVSAVGLGARERAQANAIPKMKITRVRVYQPPNPNPLFNQSDMVVTIETDAGITGHRRGRLEGHAGAVRRAADRAGSAVYRAAVAGHARAPSSTRRAARRCMRSGALDLALWDIKGKVQNLPVHALLGGMVRNYCECYNTAGMIPGITTRHEREGACAAATVEAGYRAFRMGAA